VIRIESRSLAARPKEERSGLALEKPIPDQNTKDTKRAVEQKATFLERDKIADVA